MRQIDIFKGARDFAIHGATYSNAEKMLSERNPHVIGHFFSITEQERILSDNEFISRLNTSLAIAYGYSRPGLQYSNGQLSCFDSFPTILVAIRKRECEFPIIATRPLDNSRYLPNWGYSFSVFEDVLREPVNLIKLSVENLTEINNRFLERKRLKEQRGEIFLGADISAAVYQDREIVYSLRRKLAETLKSFQQIPNN